MKRLRRHRRLQPAAIALVLVGLGCHGSDEPPSPAVGDGRTPNRLIHEESPYLLQHAHNPVDWYPWGQEAFDKARREDKPIFLSVGYSTCHWCHVMERESFEDEAIATLLNERFVPIKVDREERPDIDHVYMSFVQASTGSGGWPLNVWLTPDLKPFFGGTYFPRERIGGRPGFIELLTVLHERWNTDRDNIQEAAQTAVQELQRRSQLADRAAEAPPVLGPEILASAYEAQRSRFDSQNGGFGSSPKFPRPVELLFLHREYYRTGKPEALEMARRTLLGMADGGIHDQLAGGFHRYSTDAYWFLPHFEKMLYDQALLVCAYLENYQLTGEARMAEVARRTLDYVRRELRSPEGGFFSAEDADSAFDPTRPEDKTEGAFYVWRYAEMQERLPPELLELATLYFGVLPEGNVESQELRGCNVLWMATPLQALADSLQRSADTVAEQRDAVIRTLLEARNQRPRPARDDKILTAWNGLMISAFARAAQILDSPDDLEVATQAAEFVQAKLWDEKRKQLWRRYRNGVSGIDAFNVDYAYYVQGLLDLYEASLDYRWLDLARTLTDRQFELFLDEEHGGFFEATGEDTTLLFRSMEDYDGAEPASNSTTASNLLRLGEMLDEARYRSEAKRLFDLYATTLAGAGAALPAMLSALDFELAAPLQIILAGPPGDGGTRALARVVYQRFLPHRVLLLADGAEAQRRLAEQVPLLRSIRMVGGRPTAFLCRNYACELPVTEPAALAGQLDAASRNIAPE